MKTSIILLLFALHGAAADVASIAQARALLSGNSVSRPRVTVRGAVSVAPAKPGGEFYLLDETGGILVSHSRGAEIKAGDSVEIKGQLSVRESGEAELRASAVSKTGEVQLTPPRKLTIAEARSAAYQGQVVAVRGAVREKNVGAAVDELYIAKNGVDIRVYSVREEGAPSWLTHIQPGMEVIVTGISTPREATLGGTHQLRLREMGDLQEVKRRPWLSEWQSRVVLFALCFLGVVAGAWKWTTRRAARPSSQMGQAVDGYREVFDASPQPMLVIDAATLDILAANTGAMTDYGYAREQMLGMSLLDLCVPGDVPSYREARRTHTGCAGPWRHVKSDGSVIEVEIRSKAIKFGAQDAELMLLNDVTDRKRREEQLRQSQKMEAIGQLAGGVAHDFNNLLTVVLGYTELLQMEVEPGTDIANKVKLIQKAGERAAAVTKQLLAFSRGQVLTLQTLNLQQVLTDMIPLVERVAGKDVEITTSFTAANPWVKADSSQMQQVVLNLVANARDAMPSGGKLRIEAKNVDVDSKFAKLHGIQPGEHLKIAVSDTGIGMDEETMSRVFEPFFTTKEKSAGAGLSLSIVYGVVQQSGGCILVESDMRDGTTFTLFLPTTIAVEETAPPVAPEVAPEKATRTRGTILIVEDEDAVREYTRGVLTFGGYSCLSASNGIEAIMLFEGYKDTIDLVLSDVVMPEMSGPDFAERLLRMKPELPVLFMSGYNDHALFRHEGMRRGATMLSKPFSKSCLMSAVDTALNKPQNKPTPISIGWRNGR